MDLREANAAYDKAVDELIAAINESENEHGGLMLRNIFQKAGAVMVARSTRDRIANASQETSEASRDLPDRVGPG